MVSLFNYKTQLRVFCASKYARLPLQRVKLRLARAPWKKKKIYSSVWTSHYKLLASSANRGQWILNNIMEIFVLFSRLSHGMEAAHTKKSPLCGELVSSHRLKRERFACVSWPNHVLDRSYPWEQLRAAFKCFLDYIVAVKIWYNDAEGVMRVYVSYPSRRYTQNWQYIERILSFCSRSLTVSGITRYPASP